MHPAGDYMDLSSTREIECIVEAPLQNNQGEASQVTQREEDVNRRVSTPSWKNTLFFWRRFKRSQQFHTPPPYKPHLFDHMCPHCSNIPPCKKPKSRPLYSTTYFSHCDKENSCSSSLGNKDDIVYASNIKIHHGPSIGLSDPISCERALPPLFHEDSNIPYFQLQRSHAPSCLSAPRLPLYIVS